MELIKMITPRYLSDIVLEIEDIAGYSNNAWFAKNDSKFKLLTKQSNDLFEVSFNGIQVDKSIVNYDDKPLVVYAKDEKGTKYTLFDGRVYGYEALFVENYSIKTIGEEVLYKNSHDYFKVYLWFNYNIDLDEEFPEDKVELTNGKIVTKDNVIDIAFDSFGIILEDLNGNFINILEIELC